MNNYDHSIRSLLYNALVVIAISTSILLCDGFPTVTHHPLNFITPTTTTTTKTPFHLHLSSSSNDAYNNALALNQQRTSLKQFLTQRSVQSFMFLSTQLRDPHTSDWIERFVGSPRLLEYHGTGAFNLTRWGEWDCVFLEMMEQPVNKIIIQARRRGGGGGGLAGGSKNNPFIKDRFVEYEVMVDPKSLSSRIMAVREQIANELMKDLNMVIVYNEGILDTYNAKQTTNTNSPIDQNAMLMLENSIALDPIASSPFRKGNFDLLLLLTLHEAIHRILRSYAPGGGATENAISFQWLREFYSGTVGEYFDGNGRYGRADEFMTRLLEVTPSMIDNGSGSMALVDPARITEDIIAERSKVALEWKLVAMDVPADHSGLRKALLSRTWVEDQERAAEEVPVEDGAGAFE